MDCSLSSSSSSDEYKVPRLSLEETLSILESMCIQEERGYIKKDFLHEQAHHNGVDVDIDVECRTLMIHWCYQVANFCKLNRTNTVEICVSYLDRFLLTKSGIPALMDRTVFQLVCMTCFYIAVKVHEPKAMDPKLVSALSRGAYTPEQIVAMESIILQAINWNMNPPTTSSYVHLLLNLIPNLNEGMQEIVVNLTKLQTEIALCDYSFITIKPSVIAYCAVMNAIESVHVLDESTLIAIGRRLADATKISEVNKNIPILQNQLCEAFVRKQQQQQQQQQHSNNIKASTTSEKQQANDNESVTMTVVSKEAHHSVVSSGASPRGTTTLSSCSRTVSPTMTS